MRRTGLALTYLVALAITLGGVGDLMIRHPQVGTVIAGVAGCETVGKTRG
jgi:hypothetical protein